MTILTLLFGLFTLCHGSIKIHIIPDGGLGDWPFVGRSPRGWLGAQVLPAMSHSLLAYLLLFHDFAV